MLKVLIIDDEQPAHDVLQHHIIQHGGLEIVGHCYKVAEALDALDSSPIDLVFLDIRMPGFSGIDMLRGLARPPLTIIASAHPEHAIEGFDLDVVDYLLKPVSAQRFASALEKVRRRIEESKETQDDSIIVKVDRGQLRIALKDIACIQAQGNYVQIWQEAGKSLLATATLRSFENSLPSPDFIRVHKSYIINRARVIHSTAREVTLDTSQTVPIGKSFRGQIAIF